MILLKKMEEEIKVNSDDSVFNTLSDVVGLNRTGYAVGLSIVKGATDDIYLQVYYGDDNIFTCKDINIYVKTLYLYSLVNYVFTIYKKKKL
jgi:hypothetical protein